MIASSEKILVSKKYENLYSYNKPVFVDICPCAGIGEGCPYGEQSNHDSTIGSTEQESVQMRERELRGQNLNIPWYLQNQP